MARKDSTMMDSVFIIGGIIFFICTIGPAVAVSLKINLGEIFNTLAPIASSALGVIFCIVLVKVFWNRY